MRDVTCKLVLHLDNEQDKKVYEFLKSKTSVERKEAIVNALLTEQKDESLIKLFTSYQERSLARAISAGNSSLISALTQSVNSLKKSLSQVNLQSVPQTSPIEEPSALCEPSESLVKSIQISDNSNSTVPDFLKQMKSNFEI